MSSKIVLLNDLFPELDRDMNGLLYDSETKETGVVYRIYNIMEDKSYIGKAFSYGRENNKLYKHGAKGRFKEHWSSKKNIYNEKSRKICPIFYEALNNSDIHDWFVYTLIVCPKEELKDRETELIKEYETSDPKFGYNYFVGNGKPDNAEYLEKYQANKALSNTKRAEDGKMKRTEQNKTLPTYISRYPIRENDIIVRDGYMARIKINGKIHKKIFTSDKQTMDIKLENAIKYIEYIKSGETNDITKKGAVRRLNNSRQLPANIRYYVSKRRGKIFGEGYAVEIIISKKRYCKIFTSMDETMESKLKKAKKQLQLFKLDAQKKSSNKKKYSGSKTNKKK